MSRKLYYFDRKELKINEYDMIESYDHYNYVHNGYLYEKMKVEFEEDICTVKFGVYSISKEKITSISKDIIKEKIQRIDETIENCKSDRKKYLDFIKQLEEE